MTCWRHSTALFIALLGMVALGVCTAVSAADASPPAETLVLRSGDVLTGTSVGFADSELRWKLSSGGVVTIPLGDIKRLEIAPKREGERGEEGKKDGGEEKKDPEDEKSDIKPADAESSTDESGADKSQAEQKEPEKSVEKPAETPKPKPTDTPPEKKAEKKTPKADPKVKTADATESAEKTDEAESNESAPPVLKEPLPITDAWYEAARSTYAYTTKQTGAWTKRFEFGGTWVEGNSNTSEGYVGGIFERKFDRVFYQLDWNGRHSTADEEVTQSRWNLNGTTDFSRNKDAEWILFVTHKHLFDRLADLNYRGTFASGIGYRFFNEGEKRLIARVGPGMTVEKYDPPVGTRTTFDAFAELEARWPILDRTQLEYKGTFTPSMEDISVFRMVSKYGLLIALDESKAWAMKLGLRHDLNSEPNPGLKRNDFTTTFSVVYSRK